MAADRRGVDPDTRVENAEDQPQVERRTPPPDRPGVEGVPSRADSRRVAAVANAAPADGATGQCQDEGSGEVSGADREKAGLSEGEAGPVDKSIGDGETPGSGIPEFTPKQLAEIREAESEIRDVAGKYGVRVDYTNHPIDPENALELNKAITRVAREYPGVFCHVENVKTLGPVEMAEMGSDSRSLGHAIHKGQRPIGGDPIEPGIYLSQLHYADKGKMDQGAAEDRASGWNVSGTAEGTLYHEFGHVIDNQLRKNPVMRNELAKELKHAGVSVDPDSLCWANPPGRAPINAGLSRYGGENAREMIAEGFSEWKLDKNPRPIAMAIGMVIDRHFKER